MCLSSSSVSSLVVGVSQTVQTGTARKTFIFFFFFALTTSHHTQLLVYITGFYISTETQAPHNLSVNRVCALTSNRKAFFFFFLAPATVISYLASAAFIGTCYSL